MDVKLAPVVYTRLGKLPRPSCRAQAQPWYVTAVVTIAQDPTMNPIGEKPLLHHRSVSGVLRCRTCRKHTAPHAGDLGRGLNLLRLDTALTWREHDFGRDDPSTSPPATEL